MAEAGRKEAAEVLLKKQGLLLPRMVLALVAPGGPVGGCTRVSANPGVVCAQGEGVVVGVQACSRPQTRWKVQGVGMCGKAAERVAAAVACSVWGMEGLTKAGLGCLLVALGGTAGQRSMKRKGDSVGRTMGVWQNVLEASAV